jgi:predicted phage-related endonuclease
MCEEHQIHKDYPFIGANPDRTTSDVPGEGINVQLKKAAFRDDDWGPQGSDKIPEAYMIQVQHEMLVTGQQMTHLAVLFLKGQEFCYYVVPRHAGIIEEVIRICSDFWRKVEDRVPPDPDFTHDSTLGLVKLIYGVKPDAVVKADSEQVAALGMLVAAYQDAAEREGLVKQERDSYKAQLLFAMKEASAMEVGTEYVLTRKVVSKQAYTVAASEYVDLRIKKQKEHKE